MRYKLNAAGCLVTLSILEVVSTRRALPLEWKGKLDGQLLVFFFLKDAPRHSLQKAVVVLIFFMKTQFTSK